MSTPTDIPWGLSISEERVLMQMCKHGRAKGAAHALGIKEGTARDHLKAAMRKMGSPNTLVCCVRYQVYRLTGSTS